MLRLLKVVAKCVLDYKDLENLIMVFLAGYHFFFPLVLQLLALHDEVSKLTRKACPNQGRIHSSLN